jgi:Prohead core protein serine protease
MEQMLLIDHYGSLSEMEIITESIGSQKLVKFRGKFQEAEAVNKNKRMYPYSVLNDNVKKLSEAIKQRRLIGELDHPSDSIVHFANASHIITRLWWEGNTLMGEGEILNTPHGKVLRALLDDGVKVGISSRGVGNGKVNENGILVIGESYKLITFDAVNEPSTFAAFQEKVVSDKSRNDETVTQYSQTHNYELKNEATRIDMVSKEALIACLGGIVRTQTDQIRRGLSK